MKGKHGERPVPRSVLAPESALGSVPTGALSSAQVNDVVETWKRCAQTEESLVFWAVFWVTFSNEATRTGVLIAALQSTVLKDKSAQDRLRAEKVCRIKALATVVAEKQGIQVAHVEQLKEQTVIVLEKGKETAKSVSELLQITKTKVEGITKDMPVVGQWKSMDGDVFYLAIGIMLDKAGEPIQDKKTK